MKKNIQVRNSGEDSAPEATLICQQRKKIFEYYWHSDAQMMSKSGATVSLWQAHISFSPTMEQQRKCPGCDGTIIDGDFIIKYDVNREASQGDIQVGTRPSSRLFQRLLFLFFTSSFHCGLFIILAWSALLRPPSGCKRLLCALLCSA